MIGSIKNKPIVLIAPLLLIIISCSGSGQYKYIAPEYEGRKQSAVDVLVMPFISRMLEPSQRHEFYKKKKVERKPLTAKEIDLLENYMPIMLSEHTRANIIRTESDLLNDQIKLFESKLENYEDSELKVYIPKKKNIEYNGITPKYLFFIQDAYIMKTAAETRMSLGNASQEYFYIDMGIEYLLWDNIKGKVAACGSLQKDRKLFMLPDKDFYLSILDFFATDIIKNSPLIAKKILF